MLVKKLLALGAKSTTNGGKILFMSHNYYVWKILLFHMCNHAQMSNMAWKASIQIFESHDVIRKMYLYILLK
jgi:hypothetical protein